MAWNFNTTGKVVVKIIIIPKVKDVYIKYNDEKIANVQSFKVKATQELNRIEAFLEEEPVAVILGKKKYVIDISKIYLNTAVVSGSINLYNMKNFSIFVSYPDKSTEYLNCNWVNIEENVDFENIIEKAEIIAKDRVELLEGEEYARR